jgi:hypothetical protein
MRPGIDPQAAEAVLKLLGDSMRDLIEYNEQVWQQSYTYDICKHFSFKKCLRFEQSSSYIVSLVHFSFFTV